MMSNKLKQKVIRFLVSEDGPTAVEYAILLALLSGMMVAAIVYVGDEAKAMSDKCVTGIDGALNN